MEFDLRWRAVYDPASTDTWFDLAARPPASGGAPAFGCGGPDWDVSLAWWLAEVSRAAYRRDTDEDREARPPLRRELFAAAGFEELGTVLEGPVQAMILRRRGATGTILVFRGSDRATDWVTNFRAYRRQLGEGARVHAGFVRALDRAWSRIEAKLDEHGGPSTYCGHSLGGALATLAAERRPPAAAYTFGAPRVGDRAFAERLRGIPVHRVVLHRDLVTRVPGPRLYAHAGSLVYLSHSGQILLDPSPESVSRDRGRASLLTDPLRSRLRHAPGPISDHAPANYVAFLERALPGTH